MNNYFNEKLQFYKKRIFPLLEKNISHQWSTRKYFLSQRAISFMIEEVNKSAVGGFLRFPLQVNLSFKLHRASVYPRR